MQLPVQIVFRNLDRSGAIETIIRDRAAELDRFADDITSCRVVVELAGKHHERGNLYQVHIDLRVPGAEIAITRAPGEHAEYSDVHVALRDAFAAARRRLEDYVRRRRGAVKAHNAPPYGRG